MPETFGADGERFPDGRRAGRFAGVVGQAQACVARFSVESAKRLGTGDTLVASQADADDGVIFGAQLRCFAKDAFGFGHSEVADGVEDPVEGDAQLLLAALAGSFKAGKDRFEAGGV